MTICPLTKTDCQYCSQESTTRPYTKIERNTVTGLFESKGMGKHRVKLGEWCNNHVIGKSGWVEDILQCPKELRPVREWVPAKLTKTGKVRKVRVQQQEPVRYGQQVLV